MKTIFLDTETTGLNQELTLDTPISIGICDEQGKEVFYSLVRLLVVPEKEALSVSNITLEDLENAPEFSEIAPRLSEILTSADRVIAYNMAFDMRIIMNAYWHIGECMPKFVRNCAMLTYAQMFGVPDEKRGFKSQRLTSALEQQGLPILDAHNALSDAQMTASLWNCMHDLEYTIKTGKRFKSHKDEFNGDVVSIQRRKGAKGDYLVLNTHGASINLFDNQFSRFEAVGHPVGVWFSKLATRLDETQPLSKPIPISYKFNDKGFTDVTAVKEAK